ncbi:hypothetical protein JQ628_10855 [Bradyrhizobium lablabi]|uniref:hypothetical protein n=1 Tax=Bradyrhizobium lablabi TaxID=722472 RepID=UPI001BAAF6C0|nr:hypothetical protein [Bradyrhizobium lablabi]MBR1122013.1 hypothetical protein [Bradyrhizobium lablabi]
MPAQKRETKRNYIGLLSDEAEQQFSAKTQPQGGPPMKDYLRVLLAAMLGLRRELR